MLSQFFFKWLHLLVQEQYITQILQFPLCNRQGALYNCQICGITITPMKRYMLICRSQCFSFPKPLEKILSPVLPHNYQKWINNNNSKKFSIPQLDDNKVWYYCYQQDETPIRYHQKFKIFLILDSKVGESVISILIVRWPCSSDFTIQHIFFPGFHTRWRFCTAFKYHLISYRDITELMSQIANGRVATSHQNEG